MKTSIAGGHAADRRFESPPGSSPDRCVIGSHPRIRISWREDAKLLGNLSLQVNCHPGGWTVRLRGVRVAREFLMERRFGAVTGVTESGEHSHRLKGA